MFDKRLVWSEIRVKDLNSSAYLFYLDFPKLLKEYLVYVSVYERLKPHRVYRFMYGTRVLSKPGDWRVILDIKVSDESDEFFVECEVYPHTIQSRGSYRVPVNAYSRVEDMIKKCTEPKPSGVVLGISTYSPLLDDSVRRELYNQLGIAEPQEWISVKDRLPKKVVHIMSPFKTETGIDMWQKTASIMTTNISST